MEEFIKFKKDWLYKVTEDRDSTGEEYVMVVEGIDSKERFPVRVTELTGSEKGKTNRWKKIVSSCGIEEIGHKDDYPEYFI